VKLSKTEAHILSTLEQANGEVVSRQSFGIESESNQSSNVLEVMICRLRKKGFSIKNKKGIGYRLVTP
jgi:DNA-binding response OmpR family regulator